jgi:hypothetical protein
MWVSVHYRVTLGVLVRKFFIVPCGNLSFPPLV